MSTKKNIRIPCALCPGKEHSLFSDLPREDLDSLSTHKTCIRYKKGQISFTQFRNTFIKLTGIKAAKFTIIAGLLMIPGINVVVGAALLFHLFYSIGTIANRSIK